MKRLLLILVLFVFLAPVHFAHASVYTNAVCVANTLGTVTVHNSSEHRVIYEDAQIKVTYRLIHGVAGDDEEIVIRWEGVVVYHIYNGVELKDEPGDGWKAYLNSLC